MTLPLSFQISDDIAWITVLGLVFYYIYRSGKRSGQYDYKCPICNLDVRKIKQNDSRYLRLTAHDKFTWRNPLSFYQTYRFCSFDHLDLWVTAKVGYHKPEIFSENTSPKTKPTIILPSDEELDKLGSKGES